MTTMTDVTDVVDAVRAAVAGVDDPELPGVSIIELGLVETIAVEPGGLVRIGLIPSFSGCPALRVIADSVRNAARAVEGVAVVEVAFLTSPAWTIDRVSPSAEATLRASLGIAVERAGRATCPRCGAVTVEQSMFGPTRCRAVHRCPGCGDAVEVMR